MRVIYNNSSIETEVDKVVKYNKNMSKLFVKNILATYAFNRACEKHGYLKKDGKKPSVIKLSNNAKSAMLLLASLNIRYIIDYDDTSCICISDNDKIYIVLIDG